MVIQVQIYFVTSATLNGIWCVVTVSDLQQQQRMQLNSLPCDATIWRVKLEATQNHSKVVTDYQGRYMWVMTHAGVRVLVINAPSRWQ